jgi:hypothetical protein
MANDFSNYNDLSQASGFGNSAMSQQDEDDLSRTTTAQQSTYIQGGGLSPSGFTPLGNNTATQSASFAGNSFNNNQTAQSNGTSLPLLTPETYSEAHPELETEFSTNVATLIRLVNELPDGVTKQTGAQIIRLTMEAMGISMEDVLSDAQTAQSEMLDAVRANIKKIEEYKTVIRKLETDIKYYQGRANELSEIIDLFILSNTSNALSNSSSSASTGLPGAYVSRNTATTPSTSNSGNASTASSGLGSSTLTAYGS